MRGHVLETAAKLGIEIELALEPPKALELADSAFLTNSLIGVRPVRAFGGRTFEMSPLVARIAAAAEEALLP
jgi:branched-subunit amino acid aminotransferase/4-amino-4-deoxychorismate lyase